MIRMLKDAGFDRAEKVPTDGKPGVFATLDAGAPKTVGLYFMYDVKQVDPAEWSSPPLEAAIVDKPGSARSSSAAGQSTRRGRNQPFSLPCMPIVAAGEDAAGEFRTRRRG